MVVYSSNSNRIGLISAYPFYRLQVLWALGKPPSLRNLASNDFIADAILILSLWIVRDMTESSIYSIIASFIPLPSFSLLPDDLTHSSAATSAASSRAVSPQPSLSMTTVIPSDHTSRDYSHSRARSSGTAGHPPTPAETVTAIETYSKQRAISLRSVQKRLTPLPTLIYTFYPNFVVRFAAVFLSNVVTYPLETMAMRSIWNSVLSNGRDKIPIKLDWSLLNGLSTCAMDLLVAGIVVEAVYWAGSWARSFLEDDEKGLRLDEFNECHYNDVWSSDEEYEE